MYARDYVLGQGLQSDGGIMKTGGVILGMLVGMGVVTSWAAPSVESVDPWMVATGLGGCAGVKTVAGDLDDLLAWSGPEEFVNDLRAKGVQVSTLTAEYHGRYLVKVVVPTRRVDTVFVPLSLCREMMQEELRRSPGHGTVR
jgi:hypothetical protein